MGLTSITTNDASTNRSSACAVGLSNNFESTDLIYCYQDLVRTIAIFHAIVTHKSDILFASYYLLFTFIYYASNGIHTIQKVLLDLVENTCTTSTFPFYSGGFADPVGEVDDFEGWFVQLSVLILSSFDKFTMCNIFHQLRVIYLFTGLLLLMIFEQSLLVFGFRGLRRCMRYSGGRSRKLRLFSLSYTRTIRFYF